MPNTNNTDPILFPIQPVYREADIVNAPARLMKGKKYMIAPALDTWFLNEWRGFLTYVKSTRTANGVQKYMFEYFPAKGPKRTMELGYYAHGRFYKAPFEFFILKSATTLSPNNIQTIRQNLAKRSIAKGVYNALGNPHTQLGKARLLREFKDMEKLLHR